MPLQASAPHLFKHNFNNHIAQSTRLDMKPILQTPQKSFTREHKKHRTPNSGFLLT